MRNYQRAWTWLCDAYDNKRKTIDMYLINLRKLPNVKYNDIQALTKLINKSTDAVRSLKALDVPVQHWNEILIHLGEIRLDEKLKEKWEAVRNDRDIATFNELIRCLEGILHRMVQAEFNHLKSAGDVRSKPVGKNLRDQIEHRRRKETRYNPYRRESPTRNGNMQYKGPYHSQKDMNPPVIRPAKCVICKADHRITQCEE